MPEVSITIGGRGFEVACQDGEEAFLRAAARMLDREAHTLSQQFGRLPEGRMLLMAGLMLADKMLEMEKTLAEAAKEIERCRKADGANAEVAALLSQIADRGETLAREIEDKTKG
ncbi:MAG: cell division protein ZapA [Rhodobacteraceae bacterium]|nr:cell division protein ZapA [Paracoccaceae bacterium]